MTAPERRAVADALEKALHEARTTMETFVSATREDKSPELLAEGARDVAQKAGLVAGLASMLERAER